MINSSLIALGNSFSHGITMLLYLPVYTRLVLLSFTILLLCSFSVSFSLPLLSVSYTYFFLYIYHYLYICECGHTTKLCQSSVRHNVGLVMNFTTTSTINKLVTVSMKTWLSDCGTDCGHWTATVALTVDTGQRLCALTVGTGWGLWSLTVGTGQRLWPLSVGTDCGHRTQVGLALDSDCQH